MKRILLFYSYISLIFIALAVLLIAFGHMNLALISLLMCTIIIRVQVERILSKLNKCFSENPIDNSELYECYNLIKNKKTIFYNHIKMAMYLNYIRTLIVLKDFTSAHEVLNEFENKFSKKKYFSLGKYYISNMYNIKSSLSLLENDSATAEYYMSKCIDVGVFIKRKTIIKSFNNLVAYGLCEINLANKTNVERSLYVLQTTEKTTRIYLKTKTLLMIGYAKALLGEYESAIEDLKLVVETGGNLLLVEIAKCEIQKINNNISPYDKIYSMEKKSENQELLCESSPSLGTIPTSISSYVPIEKLNTATSIFYGKSAKNSSNEYNTEEIIDPTSAKFFKRNKNYLLFLAIQFALIVLAVISAYDTRGVDHSIPIDIFDIINYLLAYLSMIDGSILFYLFLREALSINTTVSVIISTIFWFIARSMGVIIGALFAVPLTITAVIMLFVTKNLVNTTVAKRRKIRNRILLLSVISIIALIILSIIFYVGLSTKAEVDYLAQCGYEEDTMEYNVVERNYHILKGKDVNGLKVHSIISDFATFTLSELDGVLIEIEHTLTSEEYYGWVFYSENIHSIFNDVDKDDLIFDYISSVLICRSDENLSISIKLDSRDCEEYKIYYDFMSEYDDYDCDGYDEKRHYSEIKLTDKNGAEYPFIVNSNSTFKMYCIDDVFIDENFELYYEIDGERLLILNMEDIQESIKT